MKEITSKQLAEKQKEDPNIDIVDVREDEEVARGMIPGAKHIPMRDIPYRMDELDKEKTQYLICQSGNRSGQVALFLDQNGYDTVNVDGGMLDWMGRKDG